MSTATIPRRRGTVMLAARSLLFSVAQIVLTPLFALLALATAPLTPMQRYRIISRYAHAMLYLADAICGIRYRVVGAENIPASPCVLLAKHESAWETFAFQKIFPPQVWVLKKELLRIPFFGWGLALTSPIALDRAEPRRALRQILEQGRDRLARGFWVVIFPEGTRVPPGTTRQYQPGGAYLAVNSGTPVLPVAHNAGRCWGRNAFLKRPGVITVSVGRPIDPSGLSVQQLNERVRDWIEAEVQRLGDPRDRLA